MAAHLLERSTLPTPDESQFRVTHESVPLTALSTSKASAATAAQQPAQPVGSTTSQPAMRAPTRPAPTLPADGDVEMKDAAHANRPDADGDLREQLRQQGEHVHVRARGPKDIEEGASGQLHVDEVRQDHARREKRKQFHGVVLLLVRPGVGLVHAVQKLKDDE